MTDPKGTALAATAAASAPVEEGGTRQLLRFTYGYMRSQMRTMLLSAFFMVGAVSMSVSIPVVTEEIISYGTEMIAMTLSANASLDHLGNSSDTQKSGGGGRGRFSLVGFGPFSERLFKPLLPHFFPMLRSGTLHLEGSATDTLPSLNPYLEGLLCRCIFMGATVVLYHFTSLLAHLLAYRAGMGVQNALTHDSVRRILRTAHPERVAVVNAVKLAQIITASGHALSDTMAEFLTNVLSRAMYVVGFFVVMLLLSYQLTLTILLGVIGIQCLFFFQGRALHRQGSRVTAEESSAQAFMANILQRSETIFVFNCSEFVLHRLTSRLERLHGLTDKLNRSIHGYAAISAALSRLVFVLALGLSNYYQQKGQMEVRHTIVYFACFQNFVTTLGTMSSSTNQIRATVGRLKTLEAMLQWYSEPLPTEDEAETTGKAVVDVQDAAMAPVSLEDVSFAYPAVPAFFREENGLLVDGGKASPGAEEASAATEPNSPVEGKHTNGVSHVSLTAAVDGITVLYGPSGSGKSTCLRLLCGLVRPHAGVVHTQRRAVLLEQQHAIFIGTVAENILLMDLTAFGDAETGRTLLATPTAPGYAAPLQQRVTDAAVKSGCASFLQHPFSTLIESIDHPQFSGGQLQRISLARVFAQTHGYTLVLLDEPTTGLDKAAVSVLLETLKELRDVHHKTVLISTHDHRVAEVADKLIDLSKHAEEA